MHHTHTCVIYSWHSHARHDQVRINYEKTKKILEKMKNHQTEETTPSLMLLVKEVREGRIDHRFCDDLQSDAVTEVVKFPTTQQFR